MRDRPIIVGASSFAGLALAAALGTLSPLDSYSYPIGRASSAKPKAKSKHKRSFKGSKAAKRASRGQRSKPTEPRP